MSHTEAGRLGWLKSRETQQAICLKRKQQYKDNPAHCTTCKRELIYAKRHNKFCSCGCAVSHNNVGRYRRGAGSLDIVTVARLQRTQQACATCKKVMTYTKYCSQECATEARRAASRAKIIESGSFIAARSKGPAKRYMLEKQGHNCAICKNTTWQGQPIPLIMDHIDGDSGNNKINNIRLVCGNCDMQLPTYKNKNKGKGRAYRRKRYAEGKTY